MVNILIAGYHGFGNCGDEAILKTMVTNFRKMADDIDITALSNNPDFTEKEYDIQSVRRFSIKEVLSAVRKCDILVLGGGTILQNGTSTRSLMYYLSIIKAAGLYKKRIMLYANGIGPVNGRFNRYLMRNVLKKADCITLREKLSYTDLKNIGVENENTVVTADPAFRLQSVDDDTAEKLINKAGITGEGRRTAVSVRAWSKARYGDEYYVRIAEACDMMAECGSEIIFIPMQYPSDIAVSEKIASMMKNKACVLNERYTPEELLGIVGRCDVMLSMRLHALIFAAVKNIPMAGIIYDPKIEYYLKELDMPACGDVRKDHISAEKIIPVLEDIFENVDSYKERLSERVMIMTGKAEENDRLLLMQIESVRKEKEKE
jgi:polysaccharide pyruvyl transferase CsaB